MTLRSYGCVSYNLCQNEFREGGVITYQNYSTVCVCGRGVEYTVSHGYRPTGVYTFGFERRSSNF